MLARLLPASPHPVILRRHFERVFLLAQLLVDGGSVVAACLAGFLMTQVLGGYGPRWPRPEYHPLFTWVVLVTIATFAVTGMYSTRKSLLNVVEFERLGRSTLVALVLVSALIFLLRDPNGAGGPAHDALGFWDLRKVPALFALEQDKFSRGTLFFVFGFLFFFVAAERFIFFKIIQSAHRRGIGHHHVLIVGAGPTGQKVREKLLVSPTIGWSLRGYLDDSPEIQGQRIDGVPVLGTVDRLEECISQLKVRTVFVAIPESDEARILEVSRRSRGLGVEVCIVPRLWHVLSYPVQIDRLDSIPLIVPQRSVERWTLAVAKRALDVAGAICGLLLASPIFAVVPLLIRRDSPGPVFFRQQRIGKDGRPFEMLKFRTMRTEMSGDALKPQDSSDPRITRLGRWLRRTSIDEVPQLWNVLTGDMSLVGPRPEMSFIVNQYSEHDRARLSVKPGITGLWQISYARLRPIHANLDYDLYYVEHQSFLLDLVILFLTPFALVKGTGAL